MEEAKKLRAELSRERAAGRGSGKRGYSTELRQKTVAYIRRERAAGRSVEEVLAAVGLSRPTYYAWGGAVRPRTSRKGFRRMEVVAASTTASPLTCNVSDGATLARTLPPCESRILLMAPSGVTVVGMSVAEVAELVRRLGC